MKTQSTNISTITYFMELESKRDGVHWFWVIFWGLLFWPVLLITALIHFNSPMVYKVALKHSTGLTERIWVSQDIYDEIKLHVGGF